MRTIEMELSGIEIRYDSDGTIDEVVTRQHQYVSVHWEMLNEEEAYLRLGEQVFTVVAHRRWWQWRPRLKILWGWTDDLETALAHVRQIRKHPDDVVL